MHLWTVILGLAAPVAYLFGTILYNLFFHPLAKFPGPKSWIAFPFLRHVCTMRGDVDEALLRHHEQYGEIVRFSVNELSFTTAQAWRDICGHGSSLPKHLIREKERSSDIISSDMADHSRYRRALSHAFSDKALRQQEPLITKYVDDLITSLRKEASAKNAVDMTMWYNLTTFDIISDLAFGKAFDCLKIGSYNEFIKAIFNSIQQLPFLRARTECPNLFALIIEPFHGREMREKRAALRELSRREVLARKNDPEKADRGDFMDAMTKDRGEKANMKEAEIAANANILFVAGSETTATLLSGVTYWLLQTPHAYERAVAEVRGAFHTEEEIDFHSTAKGLPYMMACLEEGLRIYPPVPGILPRETVEPHEVSGHILPAHTVIGVHHLASYHSERNFHRAKEFLPERWLTDEIDNEDSPFHNDHREVLQPFSFGPRNCLGRNLAYNEMRVILARVLWNFDMQMREESRDWQSQKTMTLWVKHPLWCDIRPRKTD